MKALVWITFLVLLGLWTGLVALLGLLTEGLLAAMASGQAGDLAGAAAQWPVPAWLALWVDPAWVQSLQVSLAGTIQWLGQVLPGADGLMAWITPLLWVGWSLGALLLLALAAVGHWLIGRVRAPMARLKSRT